MFALYRGNDLLVRCDLLNDFLYLNILSENCTISCPDPGGLEVRGDGVGPSLPLDLHRGRGGGHCGHHPPGPGPLRRPGSHRPPDVQDRSGQVLREQVLWGQVTVNTSECSPPTGLVTTNSIMTSFLEMSDNVICMLGLYCIQSISMSISYL